MTLKDIEYFLYDLERQKINYCHWKSNLNIAKALIAEDDLDILVEEKYREKVERILKEHKIIRAYSYKDKWQPKIIHYVGLDKDTGTLFHVHLHYGLVLGYDFDKNYELPISDEFLKGKEKFESIYIPEKEKEYFILVIRLILKNALSPVLLMLPTAQYRLIKTRKNGIVKGGGLREFIDLNQRVDRDRLKNVIQEEFKIFSWESFLEYEKILLNNNSLKEYFKGAKKLKKELKQYQIKNDRISFVRSTWRLSKLRLHTLKAKLLRQKPEYGKINQYGGRIVAFVGGDGAGKSNTINNISKDLKRHYKVYNYHLGRPSKSFKGVLARIGNRLYSIVRNKDKAEAFNMLAIAFDRAAAFRKAKQKRQEGYIVLQDRMPLEGVESMDCPRIKNIAGGDFKRLIRLEEKQYEKISGEDVLIVLKLNPEIALQRRPEDNPDELLIRSGEIWDDKWNVPYARVVDTEIQGPEEVRRIVINEIWESLSKPFYRIEIAGLNGTGKSTLTKRLQKEIPNLTSVISFKQYPITYLRVGVINALKALSIYKQTNSKRVAKAFVSFKTQLYILKRWKKNGSQPSSNYMIDQGPVLGMVLAMKEGYWEKYFKNKDVELIKSFINQVIYLHAPSEVLYERVNARRNEVRSKGMSEEEFVAFCKAFERAFEECRSTLDVRWDEINTDRLDKNETYNCFVSIVKG